MDADVNKQSLTPCGCLPAVAAGIRVGDAEDEQVNLEAANSRIAGVDIAEESTALARFNVLVQAGASMLSQANSSMQVALRLIG